MRLPARRLKHGNTPSKYGNRKTEVDGIVFDSAKEARRWQELQLLERAGEIRNLKRQVPIQCAVNDYKICVYKCDFWYEEQAVITRSDEPGVKGGWWVSVAEDVKGFRTPTYRLKAKLVQALHGIQIRET